MPLFDTAADDLVNFYLQTPAAPLTLPVLHLQLYTTMPDGTGAGGVVPGAGYAGPVDVHGATYWPNSVSGESLLAADVNFGTPTAPWAPVLGCAFTDAAGNLVTWPEEFVAPYDSTVGIPFILPAGSVSFSAPHTPVP